MPAWKPTPENINALPEPIRQYIHDLATVCDPAGDRAGGQMQSNRETIRRAAKSPPVPD
jgi:hypothetical protein